jgi:hypothetical protein
MIQEDHCVCAESNEYKVFDNPTIFLCKESKEPDKRYMYEAIKAPDSLKFRQSMVKEVNDHIKIKHWESVLKSNLPENTVILPSYLDRQPKRKYLQQGIMQM